MSTRDKTILIIVICGVLLIASVVIIQMLYYHGKTAVKITEVTPLGEINRRSNFTIEFNQDLAPAEQVGKAFDSTAVIFKPAVPGRYKWISRRKLGFYPDIPLQPATEYSLEVLPEIVTLADSYLEGDREFHFFTERLKLLQGQLNVVYTDKKLTHFKLEAVLQFNDPVDPAKLKEYLSFYPNQSGTGSTIPFTIETQNPGTSIAIFSEALKREEGEQYYSVKVAGGLTGVSGNLGTKDDFVRQLKVGPPEELKLLSIYPQSTTQASTIILKFSTPISAEVAADYIEVKPEVKYRVVQQNRYLRLEGGFRPGRRYQVTIKAGLTAENMASLNKELMQTIFIESLPPKVSFVDDGVYLPLKGNRQVGVETVNIKNISIEIYRIFENNLVYLLNQENIFNQYYYYDSWSTRYLGRQIYSEERSIQSRENEPVITAIDLSEFLKQKRKGIYRLVVRDTDYRWRETAKMVIATDMGIVAHKAGNDLLVWIHSLETLQPYANAQVTLLSRTNQTLATAVTDANGLVQIANLKEKKEEEDFEPFLIVATQGEDLSFLNFPQAAVSTADFDISGRPHLVDGYEAALYTDRGVYRPGETVHLVSVIRDKNVAVPPAFPVKLEVLTPDNRLFQELGSQTQNGGACEFNVALPSYAQTGKYLAKLMVTEKQELGRLNFNVEEFIPDRIKVTLSTDKDSYQPGESVNLTVNAMNLFGPPAAGRKVEGNCEVKEQPFSPAKYRSYSFDDARKSFQKMEIKLGEGQLDSAGNYRYIYEIPARFRPAAALAGVFSATVTEPGGRAVSAYHAVDIHPYPFYIGIRRQVESYAEIGKPAKFDFVVVDATGQTQNPDKLEVQIFKKIWQSILKQDSQGHYRYVSEYTEEVVQKFAVKPQNGVGDISFTPQEYGEYSVQIRDPQSESSSSVSFYASGWGYAPWSMANPDRLEIEFDKKNYRAGETAKVLVKAPFSGKLLLAVERERVLETRTIEMPENTASIEIPVKESYKPNIYVTGTLIRSLKSIEKHAPVRAYGTAPLFVNCDQQWLSVEIKTAPEIRPLTELTVDVRVSGNLNETWLTLAAVDEGICQLTNFKTPDLHAFFYAKKRLEVESFDIYNYILPELDLSEVNTSAAGDRMAGVRQKHLTPVDAKRVRPVALWHGLTAFGSAGRAKIKLQIPEFNGSLRLMAVVFDGASFGNGTRNVTVREPVVLTPTFPRFMAPKDEFQIPVMVTNGTGKDAKFEVQLCAEGPAEISGDSKVTISVANEQEANCLFHIQAGEGMGRVKFTLTARGGGSESATDVEVPLRPPMPPTVQTGSGAFTAEKPAELKLPADWITGTASYQLTTSGFPNAQFAGGLRYLLRYPYGCIEQTTSRVFPLLYFKELARAADPELMQNNTTEYFVEAGISRLISMQLGSGGFSYWPEGNQECKWGSIYAAHFLVEARKAGYSIPNGVYRDLIKYLQKHARGGSDQDQYYALDLRSYALYVLAVAGRPDQSSMIYLKNNEIDAMNASSKFLLAGAFGLAGDLEAAKSLLPVNIQPQSVERETGGVFNSSIRANAIILNVLAEVVPQNSSIPVLVKWLSSQAKAGRWYNTQDNAWAFLALGKALKGKSESQFTGQIKLDGGLLDEFTQENKVFTQNELGGKKLELAIQGKGTGYYYWQAGGIPRSTDIPEKDNGLSIRRAYLTRDGKPLNYQQIKQGDLVIAEITMNALDKALENVIVADLLPAGLEIENPRLESRQDVAWLKEKSFIPDYMDIRDDRLILFINLPERKEQKFYYALRAVTVGNFILPPIKAEAMYDPVYASVASSGMIRVIGMR